MELIVSFVVSFVTIIGAGVVAGASGKIGENITDDLAQRLLSFLKRKAGGTKTVKALEAGQEVDMEQAVIDLQPIAVNLDDPEVKQLLEEVRSLLASHQDLAAKVEALSSQAMPQSKTVKIMLQDLEGENLRIKSMRQKAPSGSAEMTMIKNVKVTGDIDLGDLIQE